MIYSSVIIINPVKVSDVPPASTCKKPTPAKVRSSPLKRTPSKCGCPSNFKSEMYQGRGYT